MKGVLVGFHPEKFAGTSPKTWEDKFLGIPFLASMLFENKFAILAGIYRSVAIPPACYRSLSGPSGPKCPRSVPESVPENGGCPRECPTGCPRGPSGPGLRSVQKVSREQAGGIATGVLRGPAGKCPPECFLCAFGHLAQSAPKSAF